MSEGKSDNVQINGKDWFLRITRNVSFWHEWIANYAYFHNTVDFGVKAKMEITSLTLKGTRTYIFSSPENYSLYSEAIIEATNSEAKILAFKEKYRIFSEQLLSALQECLADLNEDTLASFLEAYKQFTPGLNLTAVLGTAVAERLMECLKMKKFNDLEIPSIISVITYPGQHTPLFDSQLELLTIGSGIQKGNIDLDKITLHLEKWLEKYGYIPVNFCDEPWTIEDAKGQLDDFLKTDCAARLKSLEEDHERKIKEARDLLEKIDDENISNYALAIAEGTFLNEFRKNVFSRVSLGYRPIFKKIAEAAGSNDWRDCFYLTDTEMLDIQKRELKSIKEIVEKRQVVANMVDEEGNPEFLNSNDTEKLLNHIDTLEGRKGRDNVTQSVKSFTGFSANKGKVKGIARIILSSKDFHKLSRGEILVTAMTSVDFVPVMERAAAFVTNEGGITSHASIVAREMNKPCIIGTKIATQILKDGDVVEVDANNGTVKILNQ